MMDLETKRKEKREKLVSSMAKKLAIGNGDKIIAASKRKKKFQKIRYIALGVAAFSIFGCIIYLHIPRQVHLTPEMIRQIQEQKNPATLLYTDLLDKNISPDQYALYLKDILVRYDSLPEKYRLDTPFIKASDVYDSLLSVWPLVNPRVRNSILNLLPDLEVRLNGNPAKHMKMSE
jgi:hypothetical protein